VNDQDVMLRKTGQTVPADPSPPSWSAFFWWLGAAVLSTCVALLTLASTVTLTSGMLHSCAQYRENLVETLSADGYMAALITERFSCQAVFDFMDYLQPIRERHSANFINTGVALHFAVFAMWFAAVASVAATLASFFEAMRARHCCCANR
jgi:hypothetical protein